MKMWVVVAVTIAVFAAGCRSSVRRPYREVRSTAIEGLEVAPELRYSDLPVPRGFVYLPRDSWTYEGKVKTRLAELHYKGKASVRETVDFFLEQMPISGWEKEMVVGPDTKKRIRFKHTKKSDFCEMVIERTVGSTHITIRIN